MVDTSRGSSRRPACSVTRAGACRKRGDKNCGELAIGCPLWTGFSDTDTYQPTNEPPDPKRELPCSAAKTTRILRRANDAIPFVCRLTNSKPGLCRPLAWELRPEQRLSAMPRQPSLV